MTAAVVNELRARPGVLALGADSPNAFTVRVQLYELWDTVAVRCAPDTTVLQLKKAVLEAFEQHHHPVEDYILKFRGFEVLDDNGPVAMTGAREGSTLLLAYRRRRPVR